MAVGKVDRAVQYVRGNFWAGENFQALEETQAAVTVWCADRAGMRVLGSTWARQTELFTQAEAPVLLPVPVEYLRVAMPWISLCSICHQADMRSKDTASWALSRHVYIPHQVAFLWSMVHGKMRSETGPNECGGHLK